MKPFAYGRRFPRDTTSALDRAARRWGGVAGIFTGTAFRIARR